MGSTLLPLSKLSYFLSAVSVHTPVWLLERLDIKTLFVSNPKSFEYFETLCETLLDNRMKESSDNSLVQSLTDHIVEAPAESPNTLRSSSGVNWSRDGEHPVQKYILLKHDISLLYSNLCGVEESYSERIFFLCIRNCSDNNVQNYVKIVTGIIHINKTLYN